MIDDTRDGIRGTRENGEVVVSDNLEREGSAGSRGSSQQQGTAGEREGSEGSHSLIGHRSSGRDWQEGTA